MKYLVVALCILLAASCSKSDNTNPPNPNNSANATVRSVNISYYIANTLLQKSVYTPSYTGSTLTSIDIQDTSFNRPVNYSNTIFHSNLSLSFNNGSGTLKQVTSQFKKAFTLYSYPNGTTAMDPVGISGISFKAVFDTKGANQEYYTNATITAYNDSLQTHSVSTLSFTTHLITGAGTYYYYATSTDPRPDADIYFEDKDSIHLETPNYGPGFYSSGRYGDYYSRELPWYQRRGYDIAKYEKLGAFRCSKFTLWNSNINYVPVHDTTVLAIGVWDPGLERRVRYKYGSDSAILRQLMAIINPGQGDPSWYYVAAFRKNNGGLWFAEGLDMKEIYDWTCESATDSVFNFSGGRPVFKQVTTNNNVSEKDGKGRLVKITHTTGVPGTYKVMEIAYLD